MRIATSPAFLASIVNDPRVRPWLVQDTDPAELSIDALFAQGIGLEFDTGGWFLHRLGDGVYEVHTLFLPGSRDVLGKTREAMAAIFCGTDCLRLVTKVPADNKAADRLTRYAGFRLDYVREAAFLRGGIRHDVRHYSLGLDDFVRERGIRWFRDECIALGEPDKGQRAAVRWAVVHDDYAALEN